MKIEIHFCCVCNYAMCRENNKGVVTQTLQCRICS